MSYKNAKISRERVRIFIVNKGEIIGKLKPRYIFFYDREQKRGRIIDGREVECVDGQWIYQIDKGDS